MRPLSSFKGPQLVATGRHRMPTSSPQNPPNLSKLTFPPAQECQIAYLGSLAGRAGPKWHQGLALSPRGQKCSQRSSPIHPKVIPLATIISQVDDKSSKSVKIIDINCILINNALKASNPRVRGRGRGSSPSNYIYIYIYTYIYIYVC